MLGCSYFSTQFLNASYVEVRPAPHMDNLVSIYKSMEVASGFNIFVTQNPPLNKSAGNIGKHSFMTLYHIVCLFFFYLVGHNNIQEFFKSLTCGLKVSNNLPPFIGITDDEKRVENDLNCNGKVNDRGSIQIGGSRVTKSIDNSEPIALKPSFPTKKRVQVPLYPLSETPMQSVKLRSRLVESTNDESKRSSDSPKENYNILREKEEPKLSPFFWLREEDVEKLSQLTEGDQCEYITPPDVPSFSDLKDSDDEDFSNVSVHLLMPANCIY